MKSRFLTPGIFFWYMRNDVYVFYYKINYTVGNTIFIFCTCFVRSFVCFYRKEMYFSYTFRAMEFSRSINLNDQMFIRYF